MKVIALLGSAALLLSACVTPTTDRPTVTAAESSAEGQRQAAMAVQMRQDEKARVAAVAERLFKANADLCPQTHRSLGMRVEALDDFAKPFRSQATTMGFGSRPQVAWIDTGGPAQAAGLKLGDTLVSVNGTALAGGAGSHAAIETAMGPESAAPVKVRFTRAGVERDAMLQTVKTCGYQVLVMDDEVINASADGRRIMINRGLIRFLKSDDELALVMAHELAHDTERHLRAKSVNGTMGLVGGAVFDVGFAALGVNTGGAFMKAGRAAGAGYASAAFESEADYVGMYYMARAGYDTAGVEDFWRRMSVEQPRSIFVASSHPANAQRYVAIAKTRDEIAAKQAAKQALLPERRAGKKVAPTVEASPAQPAS